MRGILTLFLLGLQSFALSNEEAQRLALGSPKLASFDQLIRREEAPRLNNVPPSKILIRQGSDGDGGSDPSPPDNSDQQDPQETSGFINDNPTASEMSQESADFSATQSAIQSVIDNDDSPSNTPFVPNPAFPTNADATFSTSGSSGPVETGGAGGSSSSGSSAGGSSGGSSSGGSAGQSSAGGGNTGTPYWAVCGTLVVGFAMGIGIIG